MGKYMKEYENDCWYDDIKSAYEESIDNDLDDMQRYYGCKNDHDEMWENGVSWSDFI